MKKSLILFAATAMLLSSCDTGKETNYSLSVSTESLSFVAAGAAPQTVEVTTENVDWKYDIPTNATEWLSAEKSDGILTVTVKDNTQEKSRSGSITISATSHTDIAKSRTITVVQEAALPAGAEYTLTVDKTELSFGEKDNAPQEVTVTAEGEGLEWEVIVDAGAREWLTAEKSGDKITVKAADSDVFDVRTGRITVKPNIEDVDRCVITVSQDACTATPYLTVTPSELTFKAIDKEAQVVTIEKLGVSYDVSVHTDDEPASWFQADVDKDAGTITVSVQRNVYKSPRTATVTLTPDKTTVEPAILTITQEASDSDATSTLTQDVVLTDEDFGYSKLRTEANVADWYEYTDWFITLKNENVVRNPNTGHQEGTGRYIELMLKTDRVTDYTFIPDGEYVVKSGTSDPETGGTIYETPLLVAGKYTRPGYYGSSRYIYFENSEEVEATPIYSGSITISHEGEGPTAIYTIVFNLKDDAENTITGTFHQAFDEYEIQIDE